MRKKYGICSFLIMQFIFYFIKLELIYFKKTDEDCIQQFWKQSRDSQRQSACQSIFEQVTEPQVDPKALLECEYQTERTDVERCCIEFRLKVEKYSIRTSPVTVCFSFTEWNQWCIRLCSHLLVISQSSQCLALF